MYCRVYSLPSSGLDSGTNANGATHVRTRVNPEEPSGIVGLRGVTTNFFVNVSLSALGLVSSPLLSSPPSVDVIVVPLSLNAATLATLSNRAFVFSLTFGDVRVRLRAVLAVVLTLSLLSFLGHLLFLFDGFLLLLLRFR